MVVWAVLVGFGVAGAFTTLGLWFWLLRPEGRTGGQVGVVALSGFISLSLVAAGLAYWRWPEGDRTVEVKDDFDDGLMGELWGQPTDDALIFERSGVLNFEIDRNETPRPGEDSTSAQLAAVPQGNQALEAAFTAVLASYEANVPGGVRLNLLLADGRLVYVDVGPSYETPGMEFLLCETTETPYDECRREDGPDVDIGVPTRIRAVWTGSRVDFFVDGAASASFPVNEAAIVEMELFVYADPGSVFHLTIDDFQATYEGG